MRRDSILTVLTLLAVPAFLSAQRGPEKCDPDNVGLKLPEGFCALVYADTLRGARHMAVAPNGDVLVSVGGRGGSQGVWILRDDNGDGKADRQIHFASGFSSSEVALFDGNLYTETSTAILRFPFPAGTFAAAGKPDTVVEEMPGDGSHQVKTFTITVNAVNGGYLPHFTYQKIQTFDPTGRGRARWITRWKPASTPSPSPSKAASSQPTTTRTPNHLHRNGDSP